MVAAVGKNAKGNPVTVWQSKGNGSWFVNSPGESGLENFQTKEEAYSFAVFCTVTST